MALSMPPPLALYIVRVRLRVREVRARLNRRQDVKKKVARMVRVAIGGQIWHGWPREGWKEGAHMGEKDVGVM